jgi:hypothetical protein
MTLTYPPCSCPSCIDRCTRISGVMSPHEALLAIQAGLAPQLMLVAYWERDDTPTWHLQPLTFLHPEKPAAAVRRDSQHAAGTCTFLDAAGLCSIHDTPFKPIECRHAYGTGCTTARGLPPCPEYRGKGGLWGTPEAAEAITQWRTALNARQETRHDNA